MQIVLPSGPGWAAMALIGADWDRLGVVAKCGFGPTGARQASALRLSDQIAADRLTAEADTALFKTRTDFHLQGIGNAVDAADFTVNGALVLTYAKPLAPEPDPQNLFGYEPRDRRITLSGALDLPAQGPGLFRSIRRSGGYQPQPFAGLPPGAVHAVVRSTTGATTTTRADRTVTLPAVAVRVWLHEGGPDREPYWCPHAKATLTPDTLTLTPAGTEVLWRASVALSQTPLTAIRKLEILEET